MRLSRQTLTYIAWAAARSPCWAASPGSPTGRWRWASPIPPAGGRSPGRFRRKKRRRAAPTAATTRYLCLAETRSRRRLPRRYHDRRRAGAGGRRPPSRPAVRPGRSRRTPPRHRRLWPRAHLRHKRHNGALRYAEAVAVPYNCDILTAIIDGDARDPACASWAASSSNRTPSRWGDQGTRRTLKRSAPHFFGHLDAARELGPLLFLGQQVALLGAGEAALRARGRAGRAT